MAHAVQLTIGTSNKVSINYQSQEVSVSLTYDLERGDSDALAVAREKASEVAAVHRIAWEGLRDAKVAGQKQGDRQEGRKDPQEKPSDEEPSEAPKPSPELSAATDVEGRASVEDAAMTIPLTTGQAAAIRALGAQAGWREEQMKTYLREQFGSEDVEGLSTAQAAQMLLHLQRQERLKVQSQRSNATHPNPNKSSSNGHP